MSKTAADAIRSWFTAAEGLGEYIGIRFGWLPSGGNEPQWSFVRHTDVDGIGGLAQILRKRGAVLKRLPQARHPAGPSIAAAMRMIPKYLKPRQRVKWRAVEQGPAVDAATTPPPAVAWHVFSETDSVRIRLVCRKAGYTVNSFLLKNLTKAIRPFLEDESSVVPWMVPVNLRGKIVQESDTVNYSSYIGVKVQSFETVHDIHRNIYAALGRGEHWANWQAYQIGRCMTTRMRQFMIAKELAISQWNIGSFSNLGDWDSQKHINQLDCCGAWLFCPPVLRCQLLGAGCVTFQNQLSLTIHAHPDLTTNPVVPKAWVQDWVKEIELDISSVLAQPHGMRVHAY